MAYTKEHYANNKSYYINKALESRAKRKRLLDELKSKPCADCGDSFPVCCMDFDHARGTKEFNISNGYYCVSLERLMAEIAKCDVVCANCHRMRTAARHKNNASNCGAIVQLNRTRASEARDLGLSPSGATISNHPCQSR